MRLTELTYRACVEASRIPALKLIMDCAVAELCRII